MTNAHQTPQEEAARRNPNRSCLIAGLCVAAVGMVSGTLFVFLFFDLSSRSFKPSVAKLLEQVETGRYQEALADAVPEYAANQRGAFMQTCETIHDLGALKAFYIQSAKTALIEEKQRASLAVVAQSQKAANVHITIGLEKWDDGWHVCDLALSGSQ
jgi:hypothetical protein